MYDVAVIGCGIVGAAAAYELSRYNCRVLVLEAKNDVANVTTKANSAILHAGYDPAPGSLMAKTNVRGVKLAKELCEKLDVERDEIGSLVLAFNEEDERHLEMLYRQGLENGVPGVELLTADEVHALEPNVSEKVTAALYAPSAAIVSPWEFALALAETAVVNGCEVQLSAPVTGIDRIDGGYRLHTPKGDFEARYIINAAGLHCDKVHEMVGGTGFTVHGVRGEYYIMDKSQGNVVSHVIFQCRIPQILIACDLHIRQSRIVYDQRYARSVGHGIFVLRVIELRHKYRIQVIISTDPGSIQLLSQALLNGQLNDIVIRNDQIVITALGFFQLRQHVFIIIKVGIIDTDTGLFFKTI